MPRAKGELARKIAEGGFLIDLLDRVPEIVAFVKDAEGRYVAVNDTLVRRLGLSAKAQLLGRTARDLFRPPLGESYLEQDMQVLRTGQPIVDLLELHLYPDGHAGWALTTKNVVTGADGSAIGLAGLSRDVDRPHKGHEPLDDLAEALEFVRERFSENLRVSDLARTAGLSVFQLTRRIRKLLGLTPVQLLVKTRIDAARRMLSGSDAPIAEIALACGYCDQSAFTRQFRAVAGMPPAKYRERSRR